MKYEKKLNHSIELLRKAEKYALRLDPGNGFWLAFSGGKDSQALYHVAKLAGVKFKAHMTLTSVDPPEVIRFVKRNYQDVELIPPRESIFTIAKRKKTFPTQRIRYCCQELKEFAGAGKCTLIGIRKAESVRRSKRNEVEKNKKLSMTFDQFSEHAETMSSCVSGKEKLLISPLLDWTDAEVWQFLNDNGIQHCSLYDNGYKRIGCIMCPMSPKRAIIEDMRRYPHIVKKWRDVAAYLIENRILTFTRDPDTLIGWWISKKKWKEYEADNILQPRLFEE